MRLLQKFSVGASVVLISSALWAHGDVTPQAVDTSSLPDLEEGWAKVNPYRGNEEAIHVGSSAYNQNCARCHGLQVISGGVAPDLRALNTNDVFFDLEEADSWFLERIRGGATVNGRVYMPPFEAILDQKAMWAIRAYIDTRHPEEGEVFPDIAELKDAFAE